MQKPKHANSEPDARFHSYLCSVADVGKTIGSCSGFHEPTRRCHPPPRAAAFTDISNNIQKRGRDPCNGNRRRDRLPKLRGGMGSWVGCSFRLANDRGDACRCRCDSSRKRILSKLGHRFYWLCRLLHHSPYRKPFRLGVSGSYHGLPRARPAFRQLASIIEPRPVARSCSRPRKKHGWNLPATPGNSCGARLHGRRTLESFPRRARSAHTPHQQRKFHASGRSRF